MSQTRSANPFRPGSGILPPLLSGREPEIAALEERLTRTRQGHPQHTALLGEWAIGKTTLLMHWRRLQLQTGDAVVLSMAYPQAKDDFLRDLADAAKAEADSRWASGIDIEVGLDVGIAEARVRRAHREQSGPDLRQALRRLIERRAKDGHAVVVAVDDIDLVTDPGDTLLQLRATALELYAADAPIAFVVAASPSLFGTMRVAHEPLVRFFEPILLGPLDPEASVLAIVQPLETTAVTFDPDVVSEVVRLAGGRPYYLQKLAYHAFDSAVDGHLDRAGFAVAFERAFSAVSQEIFAGRWSAMSPVERQVVAVVAAAEDARPSGEIEVAAGRRGVRPASTRQALRRLAARGHVDRLADGRQGRYLVRDRLFRLYLELQA